MKIRSSTLPISILALLSASTFAQTNSKQTSGFDSAVIAKKVAPAVVLIKGTTDSGDVLGTGFIVSRDGKIVTNLHVVQDMKHGGVELASGDKYDSFSVLAFDTRKDIAIIKIAGFDLPSVALGNSNDAQVGQPVLVVGSPLGLQGSVSTGVVSSVREDPAGGGFKVLQTDASVNPGNSGGPMVNSQSEVIGIVTFKIRGTENLNFAIPVNYLRGLLDSPQPGAQMTLQQLQLKLSSTTDVFKSEDFPTRWKSLESGTTKIIRRDGDRMYVETVPPDAQKNAGCFSIADLQQVAGVFGGTVRNSCVCEYTRGLGVYARTLTNRYTVEFKEEITKVSPTRIEGRAEMPTPKSRFDCKKGAFSKLETDWVPFAWIPE